MDRKTKKVKSGVVVSNKMDKSVVVKVESMFKHPIYKRTIKSTKKYMAHDEENKCKVGDIVRIVECRPLSRHKCWRLLEVVEVAS